MNTVPPMQPPDMAKKGGHWAPMGFGPIRIPGTGVPRALLPHPSTILILHMQQTVLCERLIIPDKICPYFAIESFRFGMNDVLQHSVPAECFAERYRNDSRAISFNEVVRIGQAIQLHVHNVRRHARLFSAVLWAYANDPKKLPY